MHDVKEVSGPPDRRKRFGALHWAWVVAAVSFLVLIGTSGFRALPSVVLAPMHDDLGWSYSTISLAISLNLVLVGLAAPYAAALMERLGIRTVLTWSLVMIAVGTGLPAWIDSPWQLIVLWGLIVGAGNGAISLAFVATLTNRWFLKRRGLVTGVLTAASTAGQLVFLPLLGGLTEYSGWRTASILVAVAALVVVPFVALFLRDRPSDVGTTAYGADESKPEEEEPAPRGAFRVLREVSRNRAFWLLAIGFGICGVTTSGVMQTHFIPAAHDHGMAATTAAGLLAIAGVFDIVGTTASGWLTDRYDSRVLLAIYYGLRGVSLLLLPALFAATATPSMLVFIVFYGVNWIATVPPTIRLCQEWFGSSAGVVFGWLWTAHQLGGALAAGASGIIRDTFGTYTIAWFGGGVCCLVAAGLSAWIPLRRSKTPEPVVA